MEAEGGGRMDRRIRRRRGERGRLVGSRALDGRRTGNDLVVFVSRMSL